MFLQIQVCLKDSNNEGEKLKEILHKTGRDTIRKKLHQYINSLKEEFSKGMILPSKENIKRDNVKSLTSGFNTKVNMIPVVTQNKQIGLKIDTGTVTITQKFQCKAREFYEAMTRIEMVAAFTRGQVKLDAVKGGKFELFGGNIIGTFEELVPYEKIVQLWRYKQWPEGHYSTVTLHIDEKVRLLLSHQN